MEKIGKYELREVLGRGGMGVVYKAYDPLMDREVAIKVILQSALESSETKARFVREARTAGKLTHENIMVIHDLGEVDDKTYIVMEFLQGKDLRTIIDNKESLTLREKLNYARQICRGLHYAHSNLIIHRDIKPENIRILPDGRLKIMDFGIAKPYTPNTQGAEFETEQVLTRIGMRIGTPWYMAPEQVKGGRVDKRADIFSFGVVLYELLTYKKPFDGDDTTVLYKILHEEPPPIQIEETGLVAGVQRILSRCLAKDPDTRYADCLLVVKDIDAIPDRAEEQKDVDALLKEGKDLAAKNLLTEATLKFQEVLSLDPTNIEAQSTLKILTGHDMEEAVLRVMNGKIVGDMISHFQIIEKIGNGGMGVVYKAEDVTLKRLVALKFLLPDRTRDQTAKKRFLKEAQAASALDHPNICTIHEISETLDKLLFICMSYYGGENLSKKIADGPLDVPLAMDIAVRIARGLSKAHEHGIVHRDIKPANIIITTDGEVKIVDFGLAKLSGGTRLTKVGSTMGTLPFMSPEHIKGLDQDHRTDIWALGVLLYQILTGKLPFSGDHEATIQYAIVNLDPPLPSHVRSGLPAGLDEIVHRALRKQVEERYGTMKEMLTDLEAVRRELGQPVNVDLARSAEMSRLLENGKIYMQRKQYDEALSRFEASLKLSPGDPRILELRDECIRKRKEAEQIDSMLRDAQALLNKGKIRDAEEKLQGVIALDPGNTNARDMLSTALHEIAELESLDKLLTDGDFFLRHKKFDEAAISFQRVLDADPANKEAARGLKKVEKERGQKTKKEIARTPVPSSAAVTRKVPRVAVLGLLVVAVGIVVAWLVLRPPRQAETTVIPDAPPLVDSSAIAATSRQEMLGRKTRADEANAQRWAPTTYEAAQRIEQKSERDLTTGNFAAAKDGYDHAGDLFTTALEEGRRNEAASNSSLSELTTLVGRAKEDMLKEKKGAESAGGRKGAPRLFNDALTLERKGDGNSKSGKKEDLLAARTAYESAGNGYKKVLAEINRIADLRQDADKRKSEMTAAKQNVPGADQERKTNATYRKAVTAEDQAQRLYQTGDYEGARDGFSQAAKIFADAGNEILVARARPSAESKKPAGEQNEPEKKDPAVVEREARDAAKREIQKMVESYREYVERGNLAGLTGLLKLNQEQQNGWSSFFESSENRKIIIERPEVEVNHDNARVIFVAKMSFFNKLANTTQAPQEFTRTWTLEQDGGTWKVTTQK